jgi:hypothetical protein
MIFWISAGTDGFLLVARDLVEGGNSLFICMPFRSLKEISNTGEALVEWIPAPHNIMASDGSASTNAAYMQNESASVVGFLDIPIAGGRLLPPPAPRLEGFEPQLPLEVLRELGEMRLPPPQIVAPAVPGRHFL